MTRIDLPSEKKVKHLTLLHQSRPISGREFNALSADERLMMIRAADSGQRYRLLLEAADGPELVPRLPEQDLFLTLKEIGDEAIEELMPMLTPDQFTACLDLDCWEHDSFRSDTALFWLERLLECEPETVLETIRSMNFEILVLTLKRHVQILQGPETLNDDDNQVNALNRLGGYEIAFPGEREGKLFTPLFEILFRFDPPFYTYLLESARGESDTLIEESVFQQRGDRLLDLGLPDPESARGIYAWLDPAGFDPDDAKIAMNSGNDGTAPPAFMLDVARPQSLLAAALDEGLTPEGCWELAFLSNKVLMANGIDFGERDAMRDALEEMFARLNLALEQLCGDDVGKAVRLLDRSYFEHLFRLGYSLTLQLQRRARPLREADLYDWLEDEDRYLLLALLRKPHPLLFDAQSQTARPFRSKEELQAAAERLNRLEVIRLLFEQRFPFALPSREATAELLPEGEDEPSLTELFLTALANRLLGRDFAPLPLAAADLQPLHALLCGDGRVVPRLREETAKWLDGLAPGGEHFAHAALDLWDETFCPLAPADLDPRFIRGLVVKD